MKPTPAPKPNEQREIQSFDIRLSTLNEATVDILFSKDQVPTIKIHSNYTQEEPSHPILMVNIPLVFR